MKKSIISIFISLFVLSFGSVFGAEIEGIANTTSGEDEEVYYIDYDEYEEMLQSMDGQEENKRAYNRLATQEIEGYKNAEVEDSYQAEVLAVNGDTKIEYSQYPSTYDEIYYKVEYQSLKIKILEGPYKDVEIDDFTHIISSDIVSSLTMSNTVDITTNSFEKIRNHEVRKGSTINVVVSEYLNESGDKDYYVTSTISDISVKRWPAALLLIIVTLIFVLMYAGIAGFKALLPIMLVVDLIALIVAPTILAGTNIWWITGVLLLLSVFVICILKLGINEKSISAMIATIMVVVIMALVIYAFDTFAYLSGISFESNYVLKYILPKVVGDEIVPSVNIHALNVAVTVMIMAFATVAIACKTSEIYFKNEKSKDVTKLVAEETKEYLADNILIVTTVLLAPIILKYMLPLVNKYSFEEIINSEIMIIEISRILFTLIAMSISTTITCIVCKFLSDEK